MKDDADWKALAAIIQRRGIDFVSRVVENENNAAIELTIISNAGMHPIPTDYVRGELFIASEGNLDFSSIETINHELDVILGRLKDVLFSRPWSKIYLIPFGHSIICMNIKMAVFRLLRMETVDVFYFGNGKYGFLERDTRIALLGESAGAK